MAKKKSKLKKKRPKSLATLKGGRLDKIFNGFVERVDELLEGEEFDTAVEIIHILREQFPEKALDTIPLLMTAFHGQGDLISSLELLDEYPEIAEFPPFQLTLASLYQDNGYFGLALSNYRSVLKSEITDEEITEDLPAVIESIESIIDERVFRHEKEELGRTEKEELLLRFDQASLLERRGRHKEARKHFENLTIERPQIMGLKSAFAELLLHSDELEKAVNLIKEVIDNSPQQVRVLQLLAHAYYLLGKHEDAHSLLPRIMESIELGETDIETLLEILHLLSADDEYVEAFNSNCDGDEEFDSPLVLHGLACAKYRLGEMEEAENIWKNLVKDRPGFEPAEEHLDQLKLTAEEQELPWKYGLWFWLPGAILDKLIKAGNDELGEMANQMFLENPHFSRRIELILKEGDPLSRRFAFDLLAKADNPQAKSILVRFGESNWASKNLRQQAIDLLESPKDASLIENI